MRELKMNWRGARILCWKLFRKPTWRNGGPHRIERELWRGLLTACDRHSIKRGIELAIDKRKWQTSKVVFARNVNWRDGGPAFTSKPNKHTQFRAAESGWGNFRAAGHEGVKVVEPSISIFTVNTWNYPPCSVQICRGAYATPSFNV